MKSGNLEGWCWETTESAIVFFNDEDYIERGYLYFDENTPKYYHLWISFTFNNLEYVFDPCLNIICIKEDYYKIFNIDIKARVAAKIVKEELINQMNERKSEFEEYGKIYPEDSEDVTSPIYRNGSGYIIERQGPEEKPKIKRMIVHFYMKDNKNNSGMSCFKKRNI